MCLFVLNFNWEVVPKVSPSQAQASQFGGIASESSEVKEAANLISDPAQEPSLGKGNRPSGHDDMGCATADAGFRWLPVPENPLCPLPQHQPDSHLPTSS